MGESYSSVVRGSLDDMYSDGIANESEGEIFLDEPYDVRNDVLEKRLVDFAELDPRISGITWGVDPEEGNSVYFLVQRDREYNEKFEDDVSDLILKLGDEGYTGVVSSTPFISNPVETYLGDYVWKRKK
ncbi:MAG: hypothetical protein ACI9P9_000668 [Patescibacteria group bacterium]|jgi:hypothetical protein